MKKTGLTLMTAMALMTIGCNSNSRTADSADTSTAEETEPTVVDEFHADDDLLMAMGSVADAIGVGETLDKASPDYNYHAVLTDGESQILYTDENGNPGEWQVRVLAPDRAVIETVSTADIPAEEIIDYVAGAHTAGVEVVATADEEAYYTLKGARIDVETVLKNKNDGSHIKTLRFIISRDEPRRKTVNKR